MTEVERALEELADVSVSDETRLATEERRWVEALLHDIAYGTTEEQEVARAWLRWHEEQVLLRNSREASARNEEAQTRTDGAPRLLGRLARLVWSHARGATNTVGRLSGDTTAADGASDA